MRRLALSGCLVVLATVAWRPAAAQEAVPEVTSSDRDRIRTLRSGHPRLFGLDSDIARVRELVRSDRLAGKWHEQLRKEADRILGEPPVEHVLIGPRLLDKSRRALDRISTLALLYRLDGDRPYAERARKELLTVCGFADWNPSHFLDVAEMTNATAIGYDWLYDFLSPDDRRTIRGAIVQLGLKEGAKVYRTRRGWPTVSHNWNQVCNGGMTAGALAVADEEPDLAAYIVSQAVASVPRAMKSYAPDGGWAEGPGYWGYATTYNVYMLAALDTGLGTDFGLSAAPGFAEAGLFRMHSIGPTDRTFNFADAGDGAGGTPCLFWLARKFDRPAYAWLERQEARRPQAFDLLWYDPRGSSPKETATPVDAFFKGIDVVFLRGAWDDPNTPFVGFKGGDNRANHSHLDLGDFVMDMQGVRWASDLGSDNYNMPGYFDTKERRWTYYRLRTESHNTLTLDGANQANSARSAVIAFSSTPRRSFAIADLSSAYAGQAARVRRGIQLISRRAVMVQDELDGVTAKEIVWAIQTPATADVSGTRAVLSQNGKSIEARILAPAGASFQVKPSTPTGPEGQNPNRGFSTLSIHVPGTAGAMRIAVVFQPLSSGGRLPDPAISPLSTWAGTASGTAYRP